MAWSLAKQFVHEHIFGTADYLSWHDVVKIVGISLPAVRRIEDDRRRWAPRLLHIQDTWIGSPQYGHPQNTTTDHNRALARLWLYRRKKALDNT